MSEAIGETFVTITPIVDEAAFKAKTQQEIDRATKDVTVTVGGNDPFADLRRKAQLAAKETADLFGKAQLASVKSLVGQGTVDEAAAALGVYAQAALRAAKADVELSIATGVQSETFTASAALLKQEQVALAQNTVATEQNTLATRQNRQAHSQTFRGQIRNVTEGRADVGSLLGPAALLRFGAAGLAVGALFQGLQRAQEALKVTGDEALTTEGKFRNFGAALLTGDVVGGFIALNAHAKSAKEQLKELGANANTSSVDLRNFGNEALEGAEKAEKVSAAYDKLGESGGALGRAVRKAGDEMRVAGTKALALADAAETAAAAVADVNAAIERSGGNDAAVFGERTGPFGRGPGAAAAEAASAGRSGGAPSFDDTATEDNRAATARSNAARTKGLQDDLAEAKKEAADAARLEKNQIDIITGRAERRRATVEARTRVVQLEQQIAEQEAQAAKKAADERAAAKKQAASDAAAALRDSLDLREGSLQIALQEAQSVAQERKALIALIGFEKEKQNNRKLTLQERQDALAAEKSYRRDLANLNKQALADALGVRAQNLENAILAAKLTDDGGKDDDRANANKLKFLQNQVKRAKGDAAALAAARNDLLSFQLSLKDSAGAGGGFTIEDLFGEAQKQFQEFGSNVSAGGVTTGGGVRGAFAGGIAAQNPRLSPGDQQRLSLAGETNLLLGRILEAISRGQSKPSSTRAASVWDGGGPAGLERAWDTRRLTGKTG